MADPRVQLEVEDWVRENWMPETYDQKFQSGTSETAIGREV